MAAGDLALSIMITANDMASNIIRGIGANFGPLGIGMAALTVAALGTGVAAVKMAGDFQQGITTLYTSAGELKSNLGMVSQGILQLSVATGTSTQQLISGMYMIESAGYHGAAGLTVLRAAAEGAKAENADLSTVTNAVTTVMKDYGMKANQAGDAMNFLTAIVQNGKTTLQALAGSMSQVLPAASAVGVHLMDVGAAMATMTGEGVSADQAATFLRQMLISLSAPAKAGASALTAIGLTTQQVSDSMKVSLPATLQMIMQHLAETYKVGSPEYVNALKNIAGGSKQMQGMLDLTGMHLSTFQDNLKKVSGTVDQNKGSIMGWDVVQQNFNFRIDQARQFLNMLMIEAGTKLLPVLGNLMDWFSSTGATVLGWIKNLDPTGVISGFSQLGNTVTSIFGQIGSAISGAFKGAAGTSNPAQLFGQAWNQASQLITGAIAIIRGAIGALRPALATLQPAIGVAIQIFGGLRTVVGAVMAGLQAQLLPAIHNLVAAIAPVVAGILQWVNSSHVLSLVFGIISAVVRIVIGAISVLINIVAALITFFSQTAVGVAMFRAILIILGVAIGIIGAVILSVIIPAFIAWVAGAIAVGIANVIAFAPIVLIVLAIIAVVTVVVLVISHWGQIMAWFGNVMSAVGTFFHSVWSGIATFFIGVWNRIISFFHAAWAGIVAIVTNGVKLLLLVIFGPILAIGALFVWLYNHNTYFKELVDKIVQFVTMCVTWLRNVWTTIITWITAQWQRLTMLAEVYFLLVSVTIQQKILQVRNFVMSILTAIGNFFASKWDGLVQNTTSLWQRISSIFSSAWSTYIAGPISSLWNTIWSTLSSWAQKAWQAGSNLISMLAQGIASGAGAIWNAVSGIAKNIWSALGFHSPAEKGPGADADTWMPNLITMLSAGLIAGVPQMQRAALAAAAPLAALSASATTGAGRAFALSGNNNQAFALSGNNRPIIVQVQPVGAEIHLDNRKVGESVTKYQGRAVKLQGAYRNG